MPRAGAGLAGTANSVLNNRSVFGFDADDHVCVVLFQTPLLQMSLPILRMSVTIR